MMVIHSGGTQSQRRVGLLLDRHASSAVKEADCVSDRLVVVRLKAEPVDMNVIVVYMPTRLMRRGSRGGV